MKAMSLLELSPQERLHVAKKFGISEEIGNLVIYKFDPDHPTELTPEQEEEIRKLAAKPDSEIDFSDIPEMTDETWNTAILEKVRVDAAVMRWILEQAGPTGWQDKLNAMLRRAMTEELAESEGVAAR